MNIVVNGYKITSTDDEFIITGNGVEFRGAKDRTQNNFSIGDLKINIIGGVLDVNTIDGGLIIRGMS
jgi:hypothetical protein